MDSKWNSQHFFRCLNKYILSGSKARKAFESSIDISAFIICIFFYLEINAKDFLNANIRVFIYH